MEIKTVTYQCPNCNAALEYDNAAGRFKCLFCDSEFTEEQMKQYFAENESDPLSQQNLEAERTAAADEANQPAEEFSGASALYTCPNCGHKGSGRLLDEAWVYYYRYNSAHELLCSAVAYQLNGDASSLDYVTRYVDFYARHYADFPVHGEYAGKGKVMGQSLDEAVWALCVLCAAVKFVSMWALGRRM